MMTTSNLIVDISNNDADRYFVTFDDDNGDDINDVGDVDDEYNDNDNRSC